MTEEEKKESKLEILAKNLKSLTDVVAIHEERIKKLEKEFW